MPAPRLTYEDVRGVFGLLPTPATPDASDPDTTFGVDLEESRRAANALVEDGIDALLLNGTLGEAATLTEDEWKAFGRTVVEAVDGRVPVVIGTTTLNTRDTIDRSKFARAIGADGLFLGRPMWNDLSPESIVEFYQHIAERVPELGIVVYDNPVAFGSRIGLDTWKELAEIPQVVAAKYAGGKDLDPQEAIEVIGDRIRIMPLEGDWFEVYQDSPKASACWAPSAVLGPGPLVELREAIFSGNAEKAREISDRIEYSYEPWIPSQDAFAQYNIPLEKIRMDAGGYMRAGPSRPPYHVIPDELEQGARESGARWQEIVEEYPGPS